MSTICDGLPEDGGPAFPVVSELMGHCSGMTLRDHFAIEALPAIYAQAMVEASDGSGLFSSPGWRVGLAMDAYMMADAMLQARKR